MIKMNRTRKLALFFFLIAVIISFAIMKFPGIVQRTEESEVITELVVYFENISNKPSKNLTEILLVYIWVI